MIQNDLTTGLSNPRLGNRPGTSVSISNTSSLPEVIGDTGRLIDPHDASAALRTDLKQCSLDRTAVFTRERIATQTLAVCRVITGVW